jgi:hypothetical protein
MTPEEFVHILKIAVRDTSIDGTISSLERPPGRRPPQEMSIRSEWYSSLGDEDRRMVAQVIAEAADSAVFGFLCVLDGVRLYEGFDGRGRFELSHVDQRVVLLNPPDGIMLHDLYNP